MHGRLWDLRDKDNGTRPVDQSTPGITAEDGTDGFAAEGQRTRHTQGCLVPLINQARRQCVLLLRHKLTSANK